MLNMIDQCERYMAWIKHYASKLAYLLWLTPSGQVAHATLDRRLCRTRIFTQYSKLKQGELSQDEYDNWRYNYPNIEPTTGFVRNAISEDLDAGLQDALSEEMKERGLL